MEDNGYYLHCKACLLRSKKDNLEVHVDSQRTVITVSCVNCGTELERFKLLQEPTCVMEKEEDDYKNV